MPERTLLRSWATPPARSPKDSIFCARRSCSSRLRASVISSIMDSAAYVFPPESVRGLTRYRRKVVFPQLLVNVSSNPPQTPPFRQSFNRAGNEVLATLGD